LLGTVYLLINNAYTSYAQTRYTNSHGIAVRRKKQQLTAILRLTRKMKSCCKEERLAAFRK